MLRLRLSLPAGRTAEAVSILRQAPGTANLAVLTGASRDPAGDLVLCDVARAGADELVHELRDRRFDEDGAITLELLKLCLSKRAEQAEAQVPGEAADAVVWSALVSETEDDSTISVVFLAFLAVATMIAACGVMLDSAILIVGAMAVGPDFGPLAGLSVALVLRRRPMIRQALTALILGFALAIALTCLFGLLMTELELFSRAQLESPRPATDFIWHPNGTSIVIALLAGVAGMLSLTSSKSGALVGVAISVTTVPAAANAAVALGFGEFGQAASSAQQLLLNLAGITTSAALTLLAQKLYWARRAPEENLHQHLRRRAAGKAHSHP